MKIYRTQTIHNTQKLYTAQEYTKYKEKHNTSHHKKKKNTKMFLQSHTQKI